MEQERNIDKSDSDALDDGKEKYYETEDFTEVDPLKEKMMQDPKQTEEKGNLKDTCLYTIKNITLEPTMMLFVVSSMLAILTTQNLNLEKACRVNLNFTDEICSSLRNQDIEGQSPYERDSQKLLASAMAWKTYMTSTIPCVMAIFVGAWSDLTGHRKLFVLIPITGNILVCLNGIFHTYYFYQLGLEALVFSEAIIEGLSGGWCLCFLTIFSYISVITTETTRTFRMGLINFCMTVSFPIGTGLSGVLLKNFGYYGCYGIAACLQCINLLYSIFVVKDPERTALQRKVVIQTEL